MQTDPISFLFTIGVFLMSVVIHEVSHGYAAYLLGDQTAKYQGRLTLNPLRHIDLFGSIILPLILYFTTGFVFGWAKPVPYNPFNLRDQRWGELKVALAGPGSNIFIVLIGSLALRGMMAGNLLNGASLSILSLIISVNLALAVFNLIPVPPLDGSKILYAFLPYRLHLAMQKYERFGFILVLMLAYFGSGLLFAVISWLFTLFTGMS
jgi:Zn-dependent protease